MPSAFLPPEHLPRREKGKKEKACHMRHVAVPLQGRRCLCAGEANPCSGAALWRTAETFAFFLFRGGALKNSASRRRVATALPYVSSLRSRGV